MRSIRCRTDSSPLKQPFLRPFDPRTKLHMRRPRGRKWAGRRVATGYQLRHSQGRSVASRSATRRIDRWTKQAQYPRAVGSDWAGNRKKWPYETGEGHMTGGRRRPFEYRSERVIGGLPLVHVSVGGRDDAGRYRLGRARGVMAFGDFAFGLVAVGGVAFGLVSVGGIALGLAAMAGVALGLVAVGGVSIGLVAVGAVAIGVWAMGAATPWSEAALMPPLGSIQLSNVRPVRLL
jgi:hypothetical protein